MLNLKKRKEYIHGHLRGTGSRYNEMFIFQRKLFQDPIAGSSFYSLRNSFLCESILDSSISRASWINSKV